MNKVSCDVIRDLIPLVKDNIASADSGRLVTEHIKHCEECSKIFGGEEKAETSFDLAGAFARFQNKLRVSAAMVMMFGIFYGLSFTATNMIFYNTVIMPAIGALGYMLFGWKVICNVPALLFLTHFITNFTGILTGSEHLGLMELVMWTAIYSGFALFGAVIMGLLHFALKKEE